MSVPKVSVLMNVFNTPEEMLREAIESVLSQTLSDFEFLILDDGSTNNVVDVVKSYTDSRIKYFYHENMGGAATLNRGLLLAKGEYIAHLDSDDVSLPERLFEQVAFLDANPEISLVGSWFESFPIGKLIKVPEKIKFLKMMEACPLGHSTVMWRRIDFEKYNLQYDETFKSAFDYELWSRAVMYVKIRNLQKVLVKWRIHSGQITNAKSNQQQKNAALIQQRMLSVLTDDEEVKKGLLFLLSTTKRLIKLGPIPLLKIKIKRGIERWYLFGIIRVVQMKIKN